MSWAFTLRFPPADLVLVHELGLPDDPSSIWGRERLSVRTGGDLELTWEGFGQTGTVTGHAPARVARRFADLLRSGGFPDFPSAPLVPGASARFFEAHRGRDHLRAALSRYHFEDRPPYEELCELVDSLAAALRGRAAPDPAIAASVTLSRPR